MAFIDDLRSGKAAIYAQWGGLISAILCIIIGIAQLVSNVIVFAVLSIVIGSFTFLLEVTFLAKCIRGTDRIIEMSKNNRMKVGVYVISAVILWLSLLQSATSILLPAITLTLTSGLYLAAVVRKEDAAKSSMLSQEAVARTAFAASRL